jgi:hypothetical protein
MPRRSPGHDPRPIERIGLAQALASLDHACRDHRPGQRSQPRSRSKQLAVACLVDADALFAFSAATAVALCTPTPRNLARTSSGRFLFNRACSCSHGARSFGGQVGVTVSHRRVCVASRSPARTSRSSRISTGTSPPNFGTCPPAAEDRRFQLSVPLVALMEIVAMRLTIARRNVSLPVTRILPGPGSAPGPRVGTSTQVSPCRHRAAALEP